jgi:hypothetical protein
MNATNERLMILQMIEAGKISAEEGVQLLSSVRQDKPDKGSMRIHPDQGGPKWFRVRVTDTVTGKSKATVSLPLGLMDWGLQVGAQFAPEMKGMDIGELSEILKSGVEGKIIDVIDEEDGEHVEIYVE